MTGRNVPLSNTNDSLGLWTRQSQVWIPVWLHLTSQVSRHSSVQCLSQILVIRWSFGVPIPPCALPGRDSAFARLHLCILIHRNHSRPTHVLLLPFYSGRKVRIQ